MILILAHNIYLCSRNINLRYNGWPNDKHKTNTLALEIIEPYLDSLGISKKKKVLFMNNGSFNIPLYLIDRKGYTAYKTMPPERIIGRMSKVDYLLINDTSVLKLNCIRDGIEKKIGQYQNISIFSLKN